MEYYKICKNKIGKYVTYHPKRISFPQNKEKDDWWLEEEESYMKMYSSLRDLPSIKTEEMKSLKTRQLKMMRRDGIVAKATGWNEANDAKKILEVEY